MIPHPPYSLHPAIHPFFPALPPSFHGPCVVSHQLPVLLKYFKLVNNHYGCAVKWRKGIITTPEQNQINPFLFYFSQFFLLPIAYSHPPTRVHTQSDTAFTRDLLGLSVIKC
ncbi:hypothetical protein ILYODFUR_011022 [Ilyodon furcidens]|uniref:Uncharacterized protein n=1 Tax=Ilyodon furcidens TaxID=33524 RepID=A0ABV0VCZ2_9TELE